MNTSPTDDNDTILKFISEMLMEEEDELENQPSTLHESLALQATEKSLYDALTTTTNNNVDLHQNNSHFENNTTKNRNREDDDEEEEEYHRSNKQSANSNVSESEPLEMYDDFLLRPDLDKSENKSRGKKKDMVVITNKEFVDLKGLLMRFAQAMADIDSRTVNDLMTRIRQHSSPHGNEVERAAHYFANALEARLYGTGTTLHTAFNSRSISVSEILKTHKMFITACPFMTMSNLFAKQTLLKLMAHGATTLHIVDFGILFGFQWPCLILALSERPGGPPKLRITGIDFPQPGFRPAEKVVDTGRRLARYCERFGVPFAYSAIAQKWDTIRPEDLKIEKDEVVVANCMYRLHSVMDEAVTVDSPRDAVLKLMKKINPDMFVHGILHGTHSTPFFVSRFKEAFFHYSAMFDMFEATVAREEDEDQRMRVGFEELVLGKGVMNIIACEGDARKERPATCKQWEFRTRRAGFRQLPIDVEIVKCVDKVKTDYCYHNDFMVDKVGDWMMLGWKGRIINAISCWQPVN